MVDNEESFSTFDHAMMITGSVNIELINWTVFSKYNV